MQVCHTQVMHLKIGDTIIEEDSGLPLELVSIEIGKVGEPIGIYYTDNFKIVAGVINDCILRLTLQYIPEIPIGPLKNFYINYYKNTVVIAHFPERENKSHDSTPPPATDH